jgi:5-methyltetrahydropteroyltriglutamate--homocysteine methyltransferase
MPKTLPPSRAEHVGSLLRPPDIKNARARLERGEIAAADLKQIEDEAIRRAVAKQEALGLKTVTDGECRRSFWSRDFFRHLDNVETFSTPDVKRFQGSQPKTLAHRPTAKLGAFTGHPMIDHFRFLKGVAGPASIPKMTIPAPSAFLAHRGKTILDGSVYGSFEEFYADLAETYRKVVRAFGDAGCRYLQFDDTVWAYLCSAVELKKARDRGLDAERLAHDYAGVINKVLESKPADMVITTHVCRGNFRSTWISEGGYEPVAEIMLGTLNYDGYFLEYDTARAGGFEPLRFLPKGNKMVVLGLVTSKSGALENKNDVKRRIEEATKFAALDQLCLSPQCGFASTEEGNVLAEDEQWAKLGMIVELADEVWR